MKNYLPVLLLTCLLLTGCGALLERSYSVVEPYADRYWDSAAEDTLRAENHQDLVNSLLMLVEERAEEGTIRCYGAANSYLQAQSACREVSEETALGSYLLSSLTFDYANSAGYSALTCRMSYREDAEDPASLMTLSDSQSLVDLLRLSVREELEKQTARFPYNPPREEVTGAVRRRGGSCRRTPPRRRRSPARRGRPLSRRRRSRSWRRRFRPARGRSGSIPMQRPRRSWRCCWSRQQAGRKNKIFPKGS